MDATDHGQTARVIAADLYSGAKLILLTGDGTLAERLAWSYGSMAVHAMPLVDQLPVRVRGRIIDLDRAISGGEAPGRTPERLGSTVRSMSSDARIRMALEIADLADALDDEVRVVRAPYNPSL